MIRLPQNIKIKAILRHRYTIFYGIPTFTILLVLTAYFFTRSTQQEQQLLSLSELKTKNEKQLRTEAEKMQQELVTLKNRDEFKINKENEEEIKNINTKYKEALKAYEAIQDLKVAKVKTDAMEVLFAKVLNDLSEQKYSSASATLTDLNKQIQTEKDKIAAASAPAGGITAANSSAPASNTPPSAGYSRQKVNAGIGEYVVDIVSADLGSTKVIIDTASDSDCRDNCPVLSLGDYVGRNGAFAGINGSYFCPASYPQCAGKTNSFDTLLMNKNKTYFNSDNNVYSTVPVAVFGSGWARFIGASSGWGRDTSVDGVIANQPLVLSGGNVAFGGDGDPKKGSKGSRSFVGNKGSTVYIGVVHSATVAEVGHVLKAMGLENALNLDSGGSTALWSGGYKAGPGRNIPNAILFVRR